MSQISAPEPADLEIDPRSFLSEPDALYEIVDGRVVELPSMGVFASAVSRRIFLALNDFAEAHGLGTVLFETLIILNIVQRPRRRPDLIYVGADRWPIGKELPEVGDWDVVPTVVVEVVSPRDTDDTIQLKLREYFQAGIPRVWVVRPLMETISVYDSPRSVRILGPEDELDGGDQLPGFRLALAPVFGRSAN